MVDDIVEAVIDILGEMLEAVISGCCKKAKPAKLKPLKPSQKEAPWEHCDQTPPWETK